MRGSARNRARDRHALALSAGEFHAALPDDCVIAFRESFGKFIDARYAARVQDFFFRGKRPGKRHIFANRAVKQKRFLQHHSQTSAIGVEDARSRDRRHRPAHGPRPVRETPRPAQ